MNSKKFTFLAKPDLSGFAIFIYGVSELDVSQLYYKHYQKNTIFNQQTKQMISDRKDRLFSLDSDFSWEDLGGGVKRKIMSYTDELMLVKVAFEQGSIGALHSHFQTQMSYVESGAFEISIGHTKQQVKTGDTYYIPPDVIHGAVCIEKGILIDIFTPHREDFV